MWNVKSLSAQSSSRSAILLHRSNKAERPEVGAIRTTMPRCLTLSDINRLLTLRVPTAGTSGLSGGGGVNKCGERVVVVRVKHPIALLVRHRQVALMALQRACPWADETVSWQV
jgi:hypothetical protein